MSSELPLKLGTFPLVNIASLIFGVDADKELANYEIVSRASGDNARVILQHYAVGAMLASIDDTEKYFHIELISEEPKHSEIWLIKEWRESNSRRKRQQIQSAVERAEREQNKELVTILTDELTALRVPETWCQLIAFQIAANYKKVDLSDLIKFWKLDEAMNAFLAREQETTTTTTNSNR